MSLSSLLFKLKLTSIRAPITSRITIRSSSSTSAASPVSKRKIIRIRRKIKIVEHYILNFKSHAPPIDENNKEFTSSVAGGASSPAFSSKKERLRSDLNRELFRICLNKVKSFLRKAVIILVLLSLFLNSGCMGYMVRGMIKKQYGRPERSFEHYNYDNVRGYYNRLYQIEKITGLDVICSPQKLAQRYFRKGRRSLKDKKYDKAYAYYQIAYILEEISKQKLFSPPQNMSNEAKEELIRIYLQKQAAMITKKVALEPEGILAKLGIKEHELRQELLRTLSNNNFSVSFYAARALAALGNLSTQEVLAKGLGGRYNVKDFHCSALGPLSSERQQNIKDVVSGLAAFSLAELDDPQAVDYLIKITSNLRVYNSSGRAWAIYYLAKFRGDKVDKVLMKAAVDKDENVRAIAVWALGERKEAKAFDILAVALKDKKREVVNEAIAALGKLEDQRAIPYIENILRKKQPKETIIKGVVALNQIVGNKENPQITDLTIEILNKTRDKDVKLACINSLNESKVPQAIAAMTRMLNDKEAGIQQATAIALSPRIEDYPQLKEPIEQILKESNPYVTKRILLNLGQSKSGYAVDMIKPYLDSSDIPIKQVAVFSLGLTEDRRALVELSRMIKQDNEIIRATAIQSFVRVPDAPLEEIIPYLEDDSQKVRLAAVEGLSGKVADIPLISESFIKIAKIDSDPLVRSAATLGLGWGNINKPEAIEVIKGNLYSDNLGLGQASALALGRIDSPATLAPLTSIALDYKQDRLLQDTAIASLGYKFSHHTPANIKVDTPGYKRFWTDQLAYSAKMPLDYAQMERWDNMWKTGAYKNHPRFRNYSKEMKIVKDYNPAAVLRQLGQIKEVAIRAALESWKPSFSLEAEIKVFNNLNKVEIRDGLGAWKSFAEYTSSKVPVSAIAHLKAVEYWSRIVEQDVVVDKMMNDYSFSLNSGNVNTGIMQNWQQKHILGQDSFQSPLSSIRTPELDIMRDANRWSNIAIPPGGTGFNPNYMSTPPLGLERSFNNFIPPGVTRFDSRYMSIPPPGFKHELYDFTPPEINTAPFQNYRDPFKPQLPMNIDMPPVYNPPKVHFPPPPSIPPTPKLY